MIKNMYVFLCEYCIKQKRNIYIEIQYMASLYKNYQKLKILNFLKH